MRRRVARRGLVIAVVGALGMLGAAAASTFASAPDVASAHEVSVHPVMAEGVAAPETDPSLFDFSSPAPESGITWNFDQATVDTSLFAVDSFTAIYKLGRDEEQRSTLRTVERIVAVFPEYDQNRGIIRDIPRDYDGHESNIEVLSVTDETGTARPFSTENHDDFLSVTIAVPSGSYVHGYQSYVISYLQRDVTRDFTDTESDEWYWDVNGTGWAQPFGRVSAKVVIADELVGALSGNASCYRGLYGSTQQCPLSVEGNTIIVDEFMDGASGNVSIAVGFTAGTFASTPVPFLEQVPVLTIAGVLSALAGFILAIVLGVRNRLGFRTKRAIIAEYEPPEEVSVALAAELLGVQGRAMTATLLDLAVRKKLRLLFDDTSGLYGAQAVDFSGLKDDEQKIMKRIFASTNAQVLAQLGIGDEALSVFLPDSAPEQTVWFLPTSTRLGDTAVAMRQLAKQQAKTEALVRGPRYGLLWLIPALLVVGLGLAVLQTVITGDAIAMTVILAVGVNALVWVALGLLGFAGSGRSRTLKGALLHDALMGLREYIRLAEADRIRMLQSASGVEVTAERIVLVYERLLPYAVLFGLEKEWQAELSRYYLQSAPDWAPASPSGLSASLSILGFQSAIVSSPATRRISSGSSSSSRSSSSGGSSGGGFSGGGGGGGGGRGI